MATWCVGTGFGPDVFHALTLRQRDEFVRAIKRREK
jgi:hypothetical protein